MVYIDRKHAFSCQTQISEIDGRDAGEDVYRERYATYHLDGGGPAVIPSNVTLTRSSMIKF
jgi:hypothetical protein